jgi:hypothetical protein
MDAGRSLVRPDSGARDPVGLPRSPSSLRRWLALAATFAGEPPSSSDPTKRSCRRIGSVLASFRRLLLQIGGANIAARIAL